MQQVKMKGQRDFSAAESLKKHKKNTDGTTDRGVKIMR